MKKVAVGEVEIWCRHGISDDIVGRSGDLGAWEGSAMITELQRRLEDDEGSTMTKKVA